MTEPVKIESFDEVNLELLEVAGEYFGVELEPHKKSTDNTAELENSWRQALDDNGITPEMYNNFLVPEPEPEEPKEEAKKPVAVKSKRGRPAKEEAKSDLVLLKMVRSNPRYDLRGRTFTTAHPYATFSEEDANWILENVEGFRIASPAELKEYYS